jgi:hypothetical protein
VTKNIIAAIAILSLSGLLMVLTCADEPAAHSNVSSGISKSNNTLEQKSFVKSRVSLPLPSVPTRKVIRHLNKHELPDDIVAVTVDGDKLSTEKVAFTTVAGNKPISLDLINFLKKYGLQITESSGKIFQIRNSDLSVTLVLRWRAEKHELAIKAIQAMAIGERDDIDAVMEVVEESGEAFRVATDLIQIFKPHYVGGKAVDKSYVLIDSAFFPEPLHYLSSHGVAVHEDVGTLRRIDKSDLVSILLENRIEESERDSAEALYLYENGFTNNLGEIKNLMKKADIKKSLAVQIIKFFNAPD